MNSLISIFDLALEDIQNIYAYADEYSMLKKKTVLQDKTIFLGFFEPSTRTKLSFESAAKNLGANILSFQSAQSSLTKGESFVDTIETIHQYGIDSWIIRSQHSLAPSIVKEITKSCVINAGDGQNEHPTQALLDCYTLMKEWGSVEGRNIVIVGDILHSRVARSTIKLLKLLKANIGVCCPGIMLPRNYEQWGVRYFRTIHEALLWADCFDMLRIQKERMSLGFLASETEYSKYFGMNTSIIDENPSIIILHPGPSNYGVEISEECMQYSQVKIREQVKNGLYVRMGILTHLLS